MPELDDTALERRLRGVLQEHLGALPLDLTVEALDRRREAKGAARRSAHGRGITLLAAAALLIVGGALAAGSGLLRPPTVPPPSEAWPGPVRDGLDPVREVALDDSGSALWPDGRDAPIDWLDITAVRVSPTDQAHWHINLAGPPPRADTLDAAETVISYGLVFDTTRDGRPDYVVGISNDTPVSGQFRTWVTDVATGATDEQVGPPYGFPVEFSHPDEADRGEDPLVPPFVMFTFLGNRPSDLIDESPFYAWSAVTHPGGTVAWDYAPDNAWFVAPVP